MERLFANVVETDHWFYEDFEMKTVRELLEKAILRLRGRCTVDEVSLYYARKNGRQLDKNDPESLDLFHGKLSDGVREIMSEANRIDPDTEIDKVFGQCGTYWHCLLEVPPRIRRKYRKSVAATRRRYIELGLITAEEADLENVDKLNWWHRLKATFCLRKKHRIDNRKTMIHTAATTKEDNFCE